MLGWSVAKQGGELLKLSAECWARHRLGGDRTHVLRADGLLFGGQLHSSEELVPSHALGQLIEHHDLPIHFGIVCAADLADVIRDARRQGVGGKMWVKCGETAWASPHSDHTLQAITFAQTLEQA